MAGDDRPHAAQAGRHPAGDREAVPRSGGVPFRDGVRQSRLGGAVRGAAARDAASASARSSAFRWARRPPTSSTTRPGGRSSTARPKIDMVINIGALKSGDLQVVERDIAAVVGPCREARRDQQGDHRSGAADRRARRSPRRRWRRRRARTSSRRRPASRRAARPPPTSR